MKKTNRIFKISCLLLLLAACCQVPTALAQGPGLDDEIEDTPIDGGITLILATAVGYGVKKLRDKREK